MIKQIQAIYREEGKLAGLSSEERLAQRQLVVKPLVDYYICWSICIGFLGSANIKNNLFAEGIFLDDEFQVSFKWS